MPWWESGAFWGIAGIVAGLLISTAYYCIGKERILMKCHKTTRLIPPEEIVYLSNIGFLSNNQLKNLIETTLKFTNSGNRTIEPSDYATKEPLGVHISGRLYQHHASADNNNSLPTITPMEDNKYKIEFDFLKPKQSFSIALFHDGIANVFGELKSGRSIGIIRGIIGAIVTSMLTSILGNITYCMDGQRRPSLFSSLISQIIRLLPFAILIITVYFVFTVKPLLFAVFGVIVGILTGEILFGIKNFLMNFYNKFNHKGGGV